MTRFKKVVRMRKRLQTVLVPYWGEINADGTISYGYVRRFELIEEEKEMKKFTKSDLREGDVVMYDNGEMRTVKGTSLFDCFEPASDLSYYDENLIHVRAEELNIVEVFRSIWKREEPTITSAEKVLLENIAKIFKYIARNRDSTLFVYGDKPEKEVREVNMWIRRHDSYVANLEVYIHLFPMVKWEDEEPWLIEDLLKLPEKEKENEN